VVLHAKPSLVKKQVSNLATLPSGEEEEDSNIDKKSERDCCSSVEGGVNNKQILTYGFSHKDQSNTHTVQTGMEAALKIQCSTIEDFKTEHDERLLNKPSYTALYAADFMCS